MTLKRASSIWKTMTAPLIKLGSCLFNTELRSNYSTSITCVHVLNTPETQVVKFIMKISSKTVNLETWFCHQLTSCLTLVAWRILYRYNCTSCWKYKESFWLWWFQLITKQCCKIDAMTLVEIKTVFKFI